jgi:hypothetical protein
MSDMARLLPTPMARLSVFCVGCADDGNRRQDDEAQKPTVLKLAVDVGF